MPPEAGTVTLEMTQETTGEYKWGSTAIINAKPSEGYEFLNWTGNVYNWIFNDEYSLSGK